jgi:hypothetical protein
MKKTLLALAVASATVAAPVFAAGHDKHSGVSVSGHVNYIIGDLEDLNGNDDLTIRNGTSSGSRFRIVAKKEADGVTYGTKQEFGLADGSGNPGQRVNEVYIKAGFGKVTLGQGSEVGDGLAEMSYSGTYLLQSGGLGSWDVKDQDFTTASDPEEPDTLDSDPTIDIDFTQIDAGRDKRLRYDSPKLGGIATLSASLDDVGDTHIGIELGGDMWQAGLYSVSSDDTDADIIAGSAAVKFAGFNAFIQFGDQDSATETLEYRMIGLGYRMGTHAFSIDFGTNEQGNTVDKETTGLSYVYAPTKGVELYGGFRNFDNKLTSVDGDGIMVGTRVKF